MYSLNSVGQFVIQIVKVMNIALIDLYRIIYGVCLFTLTVRYLNRVDSRILIYLYSIIYRVCVFTFTVC